MVKAWWEKERVNGEIVDCRTIILPTIGCYWNKCLMCSYARDARPISDKEIEKEFLKGFEKTKVVKIFTSGSFFDNRELSPALRKKIYSYLARNGVEKLIVESRPEFINEDVINEIENTEVQIEVGIGLETANDEIRESLINKGFTFSDFKRASKMLKGLKEKVRIKVYLLLKPPLLSEREAFNDVLESIERVGMYVDLVSLNLMTIHRNTFVENLWLKGLYRPPWLWTAVEILKRIDVEIICDPVAAGKKRGPHNCFRCDVDVERAIRQFSLTQEKDYLNVECECKDVWMIVMEAEDISRLPIFL